LVGTVCSIRRRGGAGGDRVEGSTLVMLSGVPEDESWRPEGTTSDLGENRGPFRSAGVARDTILV
jgi:hypothetical protein